MTSTRDLTNVLLSDKLKSRQVDIGEIKAMDEQQKFREWVDTFPDRASAAEKLDISESYLFLLLSEKRPINDKFRAKWRRAGGEPDDAISEQVVAP